ncbi:formin-binding protein 4-like [Colias croceus]|uniref:formin-binding protein 4-like n=1 Tax=Colias crocea TaxID=72248 RepID=UPI001E27D6B6|nr:formin-binding protein 4-like [Colias croceus]
MSKANPLGLLVNYGDSDDSDDGGSAPKKPQGSVKLPTSYATNDHASAAIHPPPISHCPWSACYDENSGFTYYWNQHTNAVTWEAPPEYLLALKLAQQQLTTAGSAEVSAEEWQLYQQALAEKQNTPAKVTKPSVKSSKKNEKTSKNKKNPKKRPSSDSEDEYKIELITSYHNSDSESNDEQEIVKPQPVTPKPPPKHQPKKQKTNVVEYGPSLPDNQSYSAPIGPELPPDLVVEVKPEESKEIVKEEESKLTPKPVTKSDEDSQDESELLKKLKDKAMLLEKLGGELPSELQKIIKDDTSRTNSPKSVKDLDIDELLQEIEQKELPKAKSKKVDIFDDKSISNSPRSLTPSLEDKHTNGPLFPSAVNIDETKIVDKPPPPPPEKEKKKNIYLTDVTEGETRKLRISKSILPRKEKIEVPAYTTKYSTHIEGFSSERMGLGFSNEENEDSAPKNAINYGNGLMFTKGEVLNEDKKDEALDDLADLVEAKIKYLIQVQTATLTPVQEMMVQMQTLVSAFRAGALSAPYWRRWVAGAAAALGAHERGAAPPGWHCVFQRYAPLYIDSHAHARNAYADTHARTRCTPGALHEFPRVCTNVGNPGRSAGRYSYKREADGLLQWEYPAVASTDMEICTTPPPPDRESPPPPPPPATPPRVPTPPPPAWDDPPPPGTDDVPQVPLVPHVPKVQPPPPPEPKKEIGDELLSFYSDIAELEKHSSGPPTASNSPESNRDSEKRDKDKRYKESEKERDRRIRESEKEKERRYRESEVKSVEKIEKCEKEKSRRKSKVKISSSIGMKHKTVSSLVAKWQQVAEEINSD